MLGFVAPYVWKFLTSRVGLLCILAFTLMTWHHFDKTSAVRRAVVTYVADVELTALKAKNAVLAERARRSEEANAHLEEKIATADGDRINDDNKIRIYEAETAAPADCIANPLILDLLHHTQ